jgi:anaerobic C4-dicarboxylate transporter
VITEVAKEQGIRPSRPLSIAVVASQIAITASPISAAVVFFAGILEPMGVSYLTLLAICIPVTLIAVMITAVLCNFLGAELKDDPVYQERLAKGEVTARQPGLRAEAARKTLRAAVPDRYRRGDVLRHRHQRYRGPDPEPGPAA